MTGTPHGWHRRGFEVYRESSFVFLLGAALLLLLAFPFLSGSVSLRVVRAVLILALFLPSIYAHRHNVWLLATTSALVIASICTLIWELTTGSDVAELGHSAANAAYFCCLAVILIRFAASQETVTPNVVFAGMVVYVLLAFAWTYFYDFVETLVPGSFSNVATADSDPNFRVAFFYFSMTTITTVGYGDITPLSPLARMLAITEALTGQIYLVVMVATLVGLRATALHESRERRKREP